MNQDSDDSFSGPGSSVFSYDDIADFEEVEVGDNFSRPTASNSRWTRIRVEPPKQTDTMWWPPEVELHAGELRKEAQGEVDGYTFNSQSTSIHLLSGIFRLVSKASEILFDDRNDSNQLDVPFYKSNDELEISAI